MQFAGCEDDMLARLLDESFDARVGLIEQPQALDKFRQLGCDER